MTKSNAYTQSGKALVQQHDAQAAVRSVMTEHWQFVNARIGQLAKFVTGGLKPEAMLRFLMIDLQQSEALRKCSRESIYLALLACAVTGLEPGALKGEAYLVPFAGKAQFMVGWKGIVKQARRSAHVLGLTSNVVRERDVFELDLGTGNRIRHIPASGDRGDVIGSYAFANMGNGVFEIEYLDREDLERIRKVADSRGKPSAAWRDWPDQMSRKSAVRRLGKRLPLGADYFAGLALDQAADDGKDQREVLDVLTEGGATAGTGSAPPAPAKDDAVGGPITEDEMAEIIASENQENNNG